MAARERHVAELAASLRDRLVERRRAEAAAGRPAGGRARRRGARAGRRGGGAARRRRIASAVAARIVRDTVGLGPLEDLLADPAVEEVMVNGPDRVYVERGGRIEPTDVAFADEEELRNAIERILAPLGRRVDELSPMVDARLADGSRVNVVIPPLAIDGPAVSIRRFGADRPGPDELVELGTLTPASCELLEAAVAGRRSILVSGGTGSGKTTLLNALSSFIAAGERVVTIEDAAELRLQQPPRGAAGEPAGGRRGPGRGDDPRPAPQRPADAARPDRDRRGARRRGARPADRAQHRPRRRALDRPRQLAGRRARAAGDAGADGRGRPAARGDRRAGAARHRPRRPPRAPRRRRAPRHRDRRGAAR